MLDLLVILLSSSDNSPTSLNVSLGDLALPLEDMQMLGLCVVVSTSPSPWGRPRKMVNTTPQVRSCDTARLRTCVEGRGERALG